MFAKLKSTNKIIIRQLTAFLKSVIKCTKNFLHIPPPLYVIQYIIKKGIEITKGTGLRAQGTEFALALCSMLCALCSVQK